MGQNWYAGVFFNITLFQKRIQKIQNKVFSSWILLAEETKRVSLARPVFNLKAIEFGNLGIFASFFTFLGTLKWYNFSKNMPKQFIIDKLTDKKTVWR